MKNVANPATWKLLFSLVVMNLLPIILWAQETPAEGGTTTTTSTSVKVTETTEWWASPWVWIIGAAVFILLLVALVSGGRGRTRDTTTDRVRVTKTVERDTDV